MTNFSALDGKLIHYPHLASRHCLMDRLEEHLAWLKKHFERDFLSRMLVELAQI
jgi:hypothetical protein